MTAPAEDEIVLKLLHTADWHLGRRFKAFTEEQETKLTRARLEVIERIFLLAERSSADAVLCAGDLFDVPCPPAVGREQRVELLRKRQWKNRPVFLLPGNHDPLVPGSVWAAGSSLRSQLPEWVHVVDCEDFRFDLPNGAVLHAVPCVSQSGAQDP